MRSNSANGVVATGCSAANPPTRLTSAFNGAPLASAVRTARATSSGSVRSPTTVLTPSVASRSDSASTGTTTLQPSSTRAATTERPRPPAPPVTRTVRSGIEAIVVRPTLDLGFVLVRVRELTPGQEIDLVLMVRSSDAQRLILGDRTGTLEAAPQHAAAGECVCVTGRVEGRGRLELLSIRRAEPGEYELDDLLDGPRIP